MNCCFHFHSLGLWLINFIIPTPKHRKDILKNKENRLSIWEWFNQLLINEMRLRLMFIISLYSRDKNRTELSDWVAHSCILCSLLFAPFISLLNAYTHTLRVRICSYCIFESTIFLLAKMVIPIKKHVETGCLRSFKWTWIHSHAQSNEWTSLWVDNLHIQYVR